VEGLLGEVGVVRNVGVVGEVAEVYGAVPAEEAVAARANRPKARSNLKPILSSVCPLMEYSVNSALRSSFYIENLK